MKRYFFDIADGWVSKDERGTEFVDYAAARSMAIKMAAEILRSRAHSLNGDHRWDFILRNETKESVFELSINSKSIAEAVS